MDRERVLREAADWVWVPVDAEDLTGPDYRLTRYPEWASVQWSRTERPFEELLEEVLARSAGTPVLRWWTRESTRSADTAARLESHGFGRAETLDVLALDLAAPAAVAELRERLEVPPDVQVRPVLDEDGVRVAGHLAAQAFDESAPTEAQVAEAVTQLAEEQRTGRWLVRRWVARLGGRPVGSAGATLSGQLVRLWGGAVLADARGRGVYRALLAARCADAVRAGATVALVKGRVQTSAPVLRRAGFEVLGREQCYELRRPADDGQPAGRAPANDEFGGGSGST